MLEDRVEASRNAESPRDQTSLCSFLGKLGFYEKFLEHRADVCAPLHALLRKDAEWRWTDVEERAFVAAKQLLWSDRVLTHYVPELPLTLAVDFSPWSSGSVLSHIMPDGTERPIAYSSRRFTDTDCRYSQFDRELLGLVVALKRFHPYIAGRSFHVYMDNLAAVRMLRKRLPGVASPRVLLWKIRLGAYNFTVEHRPVARHQNADALSRCPDGRRLAVSTSDFDKDVVAGIYFLTPGGNDEYHLSLTAALAPSEAARATAADPLLQDVLRFVLAGWPAKCPGERFQPYFRIREGLTVVRDCLMHGDRVVIPASLIHAVRQAMQDLHVGLGKASAVCRLYLWFPSWKAAVRDAVQTCTSFQLTRPNPPRDRLFASRGPVGAPACRFRRARRQDVLCHF